MSETEQKETKPNVSHSTQIGSVTGQVHTGSGDIHVKSFSVGNIANQEDFVAALQHLKDELKTARQKGLDEDTTDDTLTELEAAEREAKKEGPKADRILKRLQQAQAILVAGTGVATAATAVTAAVNNLLPLLEKAIQMVGQIF